ncbi:MAG: AEC family transporter [Lentisphaeraceae bacterium]|nr:AEC family transporter [Lentisphaeraceae bacterium]
MQDIFSIVFNSIFPVFFIIGLGFYLFKTGFIGKELQQGLNKLAYWFGLPAFLFYKICFAKLEGQTAGRLLICIVSGTLVCMALGYLSARLFKAPKASAGASLQASGRGNLAFIALPIIFVVIKQVDPSRSEVIIDSVILSLTPLIILYNLICVTFLVSHSTRVSENVKKDIIREIFTNPLILACGLGLAFNFYGPAVSPDTAMFRVCNTIGQSAFPMALLGVGSQLAQISIKGHVKWVVVFAFIKTVIGPAAGFTVSRFMNLDDTETLAVMILLSSPTAVAAYVLADQLQCDPDLTASTIMLSTIFSFFTFSVILIFFSGVI